jgi:hypothetical protein
MGIRKKRKLEEIQELQESNAVKKRVEHSLLEAQSSGADSNVFLLDTANATNVDTLEESDLTKTNYDVLDNLHWTDTKFDTLDDLDLTETKFDILED